MFCFCSLIVTLKVTLGFVLVLRGEEREVCWLFAEARDSELSGSSAGRCWKRRSGFVEVEDVTEAERIHAGVLEQRGRGSHLLPAGTGSHVVQLQRKVLKGGNQVDVLGLLCNGLQFLPRMIVPFHEWVL